MALHLPDLPAGPTPVGPTIWTLQPEHVDVLSLALFAFVGFLTTHPTHPKARSEQATALSLFRWQFAIHGGAVVLMAAAAGTDFLLLRRLGGLVTPLAFFAAIGTLGLWRHVGVAPLKDRRWALASALVCAGMFGWAPWGDSPLVLLTLAITTAMVAWNPGAGARPVASVAGLLLVSLGTLHRAASQPHPPANFYQQTLPSFRHAQRLTGLSAVDTWWCTRPDPPWSWAIGVRAPGWALLSMPELSTAPAPACEERWFVPASMTSSRTPPPPQATDLPSFPSGLDRLSVRGHTRLDPFDPASPGLWVPVDRLPYGTWSERKLSARWGRTLEAPFRFQTDRHHTAIVIDAEWTPDPGTLTQLTAEVRAMPDQLDQCAVSGHAGPLTLEWTRATTPPATPLQVWTAPLPPQVTSATLHVEVHGCEPDWIDLYPRPR